MTHCGHIHARDIAATPNMRNALICRYMIVIMKQLLTLVILVLFPSTGWTEIYLYPDKVERNIDCDLPPETIAAIEYRYSDSGAVPAHTGIAKAKPVDLNADGTCEVYLDHASMNEGNGNPFTSILGLEKGEYVQLAAIYGEFTHWWYGTPRTGYLKIIVGENAGSKGNPIFVTDVYYFDGSRYVKEFDSEFSHGRYMDLGQEAYQRQDYVTAEKYYLNAFRMRSEQDPVDANNLSLTWIKQGKLDAAHNLLDRVLAGAKRKKVRSAAYYNLGLLEEARNNAPAAAEYFTQANVELQPERNHVRNGSFDSDVSSWTDNTNLPTGVPWTYNSSIKWSNNSGHQSPGSIRVEISSSIDEVAGRTVLYQCIGVDSGSTYNVGASYKRDDGNATQDGSARVLISWFDHWDCKYSPRKGENKVMELQIQSGAEWQETGPVKLVPPSRAQGARIYLVQNVGGKGVFSLYWDDIYFRPIEDRTRGFVQ